MCACTRVSQARNEHFASNSMTNMCLCDGHDDGSGSDSVTVTMAESRARSSISMRENPSRIHRKHPWELQAEALSLGSVIGAGSHGQVYRGMYVELAAKKTRQHSSVVVLGLELSDGKFIAVLVHLSYCRYKGSEVAVKTLLILPEDTRASGALSDRIFEETASEAQALSLLRHENMMRFFGICFLQQTRTIAMVTELCKCDLRAWIDETHGHTDNEIWEVALQIAKVTDLNFTPQCAISALVRVINHEYLISMHGMHVYIDVLLLSCRGSCIFTRMQGWFTAI